jgi:hypothetical protein
MAVRADVLRRLNIHLLVFNCLLLPSLSEDVTIEFIF